MSQKNFASYGDMETLVTEIADKCGPYTKISYEDWLNLTPYQQEHGRWDVTGVPGADGTVSIDLMTKLWENSDPTHSFAAQDITLSSDDYDFLLGMCNTSQTTTLMISCIAKKGSGLSFVRTDTYNGVCNIWRNISYVDDTHLSVANCMYNAAADNTKVIPVVIYGIKLHHTVEIKAIAPEVSTLASKCMMSDGETSVEDKLSGYVTIRNTSPSSNLTWKHGDFVYFNSYKPSDTNYTWYLLNVMPATASIILCGIQTIGERALVHLPGGGSLQASCNITWLGVKN